MARTGVTEAQVADAADALLVAGERPTIERVRTALGTGSPNTLIRHLDAWWTGLGRRLTEKQRQVAIPDAPAEVSDAASAVWRIALEQAGKLARAGLEREREALRSQQTQLEAQVAAAAEAIETAKSATDEARQAVGMAEVRAEGLEKLRDQQQALIKTLEAELDRELTGSQALKEAHERSLQLLEQTRGQASADREAAAAHIQAVENRAHQEVDRARGETTKATRRVGELDKQVQRLQTESAQRLESLARELRRSEAEAASLKLKLAAATKPKRKTQAGILSRKKRQRPRRINPQWNEATSLVAAELVPSGSAVGLRLLAADRLKTKRAEFISEAQVVCNLRPQGLFPAAVSVWSHEHNAQPALLKGCQRLNLPFGA